MGTEAIILMSISWGLTLGMLGFCIVAHRKRQ